jgi:glycerol kinase
LRRGLSDSTLRLQELRRNWGVDNVWEPSMDSALREALYRDWKRAMERSFGWVEEHVPA